MQTVSDIGGVSMCSLKDYILSAIWFLLSIIMVAVGESYSDCNLGVLFYLKIRLPQMCIRFICHCDHVVDLIVPSL